MLTIEHALSPEECDWLVREAEAAAGRRGGWHGDRHRGYATTDLRAAHVSPEVHPISPALIPLFVKKDQPSWLNCLLRSRAGSIAWHSKGCFLFSSRTTHRWRARRLMMCHHYTLSGICFSSNMKVKGSDLSGYIEMVQL